ncbi:hypothetical protein C1646_770073 [Rhizophagus diaphanus]|nr:hypothetical protein C1646_770073 [Rhizophagus diaphanus] [Rhizophagus sp. MUCL 43196]
MNRVFTNYFDEISEALHVSAFFDSRYKKLAYGDMSQNNIFEPISSNQTPQPVLNELELYFTSNSPGDEIVPLEW